MTYHGHGWDGDCVLATPHPFVYNILPVVLYEYVKFYEQHFTKEMSQITTYFPESDNVKVLKVG